MKLGFELSRNASRGNATSVEFQTDGAETKLTEKEKSETRMTASVLKQDPNTLKVPKNAVY